MSKLKDRICSFDRLTLLTALILVALIVCGVISFSPGNRRFLYV